MPSAIVSGATNPPLKSGWPIELGQETAAGINIDDVDGDGIFNNDDIDDDNDGIDDDVDHDDDNDGRDARRNRGARERQRRGRRSGSSIGEHRLYRVCDADLWQLDEQWQREL